MKYKPAILPTNKADPTGADSLERRAMAEFRRKLIAVRRVYVNDVKAIPKQEITVNVAGLATNAKRYAFLIDSIAIDEMFRSWDTIVDSIMLEGGENRLWFFESYVRPAYQKGTAQSFTNLGYQSEAYKAGRGSLEQLLYSEPYRRRIALSRARVYEEMKGFTAQLKADMARVVSEGIGRGLGTSAIADTLEEQLGIEERRANKIARTEVPMALRRARWDESDQAAEDYALESRMMHISALSPTTRRTHADRHAKLYTTEQIREWYSKDGNAINCKCGQIEVLVDENGKPLVPSIIERARNNFKSMKQKSDAPWAED